MDAKAIEIILQFYMSKLTEGDLRELDNLLAEANTSLDVPRDLNKAGTPAQDAAYGTSARQNFLKLGPKGRNGMRSGGLAHLVRHGAIACDGASGAFKDAYGSRLRMAQDSAPAKGGITIADEAQFPNAKRLRGY